MDTAPREAIAATPSGIAAILVIGLEQLRQFLETLTPEPSCAAGVGTGKAEAWQDGTSARLPAQDYEFTVVQRRFMDELESVKMMNRRVDLSLESSMGAGAGSADTVLRAFEFALDIAAPALARRMMPFDRLGFLQKHA